MVSKKLIVLGVLSVSLIDFYISKIFAFIYFLRALEISILILIQLFRAQKRSNIN